MTTRLGEPVYERIDAPATRAQKAALQKFSTQQVQSRELAGEPITAMLTEAPGNKASIGGLKVTRANGWFAARPGGIEDVYKLCAEASTAGGCASVDQAGLLQRRSLTGC